MKKIIFLFIMLFSLFFIACCENDSTKPSNEENQGTNTPTNNNQGENQNDDTDTELTIEELLKKLYPIPSMHKLDVKHSKITNTDYEYLYLGYYPSKVITDQRIIDELDQITTTNDLGYISLYDYFFEKVDVVNNHKYATIDQQKDSIFEYGTGFKPNNSYYFLVEPICWKVIRVQGKIFTLQTEQIIDARIFNTSDATRIIDGKTIYASNYEYSSIRDWLNNDFYNKAFSLEEKEMIMQTQNNNEPELIYISSYSKDNDTLDYVYLMSYQESVNPNYGFASLAICDSTRFAEATDYASSHGLIRHPDGSYSTSIWALRNGFEYTRDYMSYVSYDGSTCTNFYVDAPNVGIRPCLRIIIEE